MLRVACASWSRGFATGIPLTHRFRAVLLNARHRFCVEPFSDKELEQEFLASRFVYLRSFASLMLVLLGLPSIQLIMYHLQANSVQTNNNMYVILVHAMRLLTMLCVKGLCLPSIVRRYPGPAMIGCSILVAVFTVFIIMENAEVAAQYTVVFRGEPRKFMLSVLEHMDRSDMEKVAGKILPNFPFPFFLCPRPVVQYDGQTVGHGPSLS